MPYPESCPECGGVFRNTGTHFTARRNEIGRHVLLELGCQNTSRRFWWDFTTGSLTEDGQTTPTRRSPLAASLDGISASNGTLHAQSNGHAGLSTLEAPPRFTARDVELPAPEADVEPELEPDMELTPVAAFEPALDVELDLEVEVPEPVLASEADSAIDQDDLDEAVVALPGVPPSAPAPLKEAFVRQLQLDRLTLRQMRSWLMSDEARRAIEVAAGATEATYERLALILFGADLAQLLGRQATAPVSTGISAEERLELQREKARVRARLRRAAAKAAREQSSPSPN
jgi:hypothetical protein